MIVISNRMPNPFIKIALRMTLYGTVLGAGLGFLIDYVSWLFSDQSQNYTDMIHFILSGIMSSIVWGGGISMIRGGIAGMLIGLVMMIVTAIFFREMTNSRIYRATMAGIALVTSLIVSRLLGINFLINESDMMSTLNGEVDWKIDFPGLGIYLLSILIAVAASQRAANKYLQEINPRKTKEKVK